jgi:hypothetical protein
MQADTPYLVVGNTFTGQAVATVKPPPGVFFTEVYGGAAGDRTFIVTGDQSHSRPSGADTGPCGTCCASCLAAAFLCG